MYHHYNQTGEDLTMKLISTITDAVAGIAALTMDASFGFLAGVLAPERADALWNGWGTTEPELPEEDPVDAAMQHHPAHRHHLARMQSDPVYKQLYESKQRAYLGLESGRWCCSEQRYQLASDMLDDYLRRLTAELDNQP
jgi:hypothetical protein